MLDRKSVFIQCTIFKSLVFKDWTVVLLKPLFKHKESDTMTLAVFPKKLYYSTDIEDCELGS